MTPSTRIARRFKGKVQDDYLGLIMKFPLTSIRSDVDLAAAQDVIDQLLAEEGLSTGKRLYLDALSDLVAAYEDNHHRVPPASDADMLLHLMEAKGVNQAQLHRDTKIPKSTISEILSGKKVFSRQIIVTLASYFGVDKSVLAHNL